MQIKLNKRIYRLKAIRQAIKAYSHLAQFSLRQDSRYYQLTLDNTDPALKDILKDEFANYILALNKDAR